MYQSPHGRVWVRNCSDEVLVDDGGVSIPAWACMGAYGKYDYSNDTHVYQSPHGRVWVPNEILTKMGFKPGINPRMGVYGCMAEHSLIFRSRFGINPRMGVYGCPMQNRIRQIRKGINPRMGVYGCGIDVEPDKVEV